MATANHSGGGQRSPVPAAANHESPHEMDGQELASSLSALQRTLFERIPEAVLIANRAGSIVDANLAALSTIGYVRDELTSLRVSDLISPAPSWLESGEFDSAFAGPDGLWHGVVELRGKDGARTRREIRVEAPLGAEAGIVVTLIRDPDRDDSASAMARDASDRQVEQALAASEARYRALVDDVPAVIYTEQDDREHTLTYMSRYVETLLGYAAEAFFADRGLWMTRVHPDDRDRVQASANRMNAMREPFHEEYRLIARDGRIVWVNDVATPMRDGSDQIDGWQGLALDVTARKRLEQELWDALEAARSANLATSGFLAMMSHDLRTPMQAVLGYADLLSAGRVGSLSADQALDVQCIQQGARRIIALIDQMLDLSRMQAGHLELTLTPLDLAPIIAQVRRDVAPQAASKALNLSIDLPSSLPLVLADASRLHQILLNLAGNAVKFTARGWVRLSACATGHGVDVAVSDSGIGIAPDALEYIFDDFRQADSTTHRRYGGAGLGLAIARRLAEQQGGSITVTSQPGEGSTFTLHLPGASYAGVMG